MRRHEAILADGRHRSGQGVALRRLGLLHALADRTLKRPAAGTRSLCDSRVLCHRVCESKHLAAEIAGVRLGFSPFTPPSRTRAATWSHVAGPARESPRERKEKPALTPAAVRSKPAAAPGGCAVSGDGAAAKPSHRACRSRRRGCRKTRHPAEASKRIRPAETAGVSRNNRVRPVPGALGAPFAYGPGLRHGPLRRALGHQPSKGEARCPAFPKLRPDGLKPAR